MAAALPFPDAAAAHDELARIAGEASLRAVQIVAQTTHYRPDSGFDETFSLAAAERLPILLHPAAGVADLSPAFGDYGLSSGMHAMVSHALVASRMIQSGLLDRIDKLELIVTHLGGILPFLIDRLDSRHTGPALHAPSHYLRTRVHVDNCGYPAGPALRLAIDTIGVERLLIGSDWPSRPIAPALDSIRGMRLNETDERAVMGGNAARWFDPAIPRVQ
jgi:predicted TIM-barrel fold metal-dependent hydrolase